MEPVAKTPQVKPVEIPDLLFLVAPIASRKVEC